MAASSAENRMNLAALQQCDPYIDGIVQTATQVALYTFNGSANEWEKTDIEGSLFVYSRSATPHNGFMIMNRLSMNNLTEPVTKELEFQHQDPFLLYRNAKSIYGLWFYDKKECANVTRVMNGLVHKARQQAKANARQRSISESSAGRLAIGGVAGNVGSQSRQVDIMQMLSKAQHEYNQSKHTEPSDNTSSNSSGSSQLATGSPTIVRPIPVKANDKPQQSKLSKGQWKPGQGAQGQRSNEDMVLGDLKGMKGRGQQQQQQPRFKRSVSMQEPSQSQMPPALQKLMQSGIPPGNIDHPLTKGEVMTVGSLENVLASSSKDSTDGGPSGKKSEAKQGKKPGQFMTVESLENIHGAAGSKGKSEEGQSVPIQNLLAQLHQQKQSSVAEGSISKLAPSQGGSVADSNLASLLSINPNNKSEPEKQTLLTNPVPQSNPDLTQTLLANLVAPTTKSTGLLLPQDLTQGSQPGSPASKQGANQPLLGAEGGGHQVPSLQQIAAGGMQPSSGNALLQSLQPPASGAGDSLPLQTSPQRIPASVAPPTLLTPQAFSQRATSDAVSSTNPTFPSSPLIPASGLSQSGVDKATDRSQTVPLLGLGVGQQIRQASVRIDQLTKEQFQEAFVHLIRTDDDFLSKLYVSYLTTQQQKQ